MDDTSGEELTRSSQASESEVPFLGSGELDITNTDFFENLGKGTLLRTATAEVLEVLQEPASDEAKQRLAWGVYAQIIETIVESIPEHEDRERFAFAQIAAILHKALIFQKVGNTLRYLEQLDRAEVYARNKHLDAFTSAIQAEIDAHIELLDLSPEILIIKVKGWISELNREYLRDLIYEGIDLDDMIDEIYEMISDKGGDPGQFFADIGYTGK